MPIEYTLLKDEPSPFRFCPMCGAYPFQPFMRGQVQRAGWYAPWDWLVAKWNKMPFAYCAVICSTCHEIVGHECPPEKP